MSQKKKRAKRHENKIHNNSVAQPKKIPDIIIWDGIKLSLKKQFHALVKDRVCAAGLFWLFECSVNNLRCICIEKPDQYQYLGNCPPTPPLTQQQSINNKLGLMLG